MSSLQTPGDQSWGGGPKLALDYKQHLANYRVGRGTINERWQQVCTSAQGGVVRESQQWR